MHFCHMRMSCPFPAFIYSPSSETGRNRFIILIPAYLQITGENPSETHVKFITHVFIVKSYLGPSQEGHYQ